MSKISKDVVYNGTLNGSEITIRSAENSTLFINGIWISNSGNVDASVLIKFDDKKFIPNLSLAPSDTLIQKDLEIPILPTKTIKISSNISGVVDYYIWGIRECIAPI